MSKAYAVNAKFDDANFTNSVLDRVVFNGAEAPLKPAFSSPAVIVSGSDPAAFDCFPGSSMKGASFVNAVITGSTFDDADMTGAVFLDSLIGQEDLKRLCQNKTVVGETRFQVGCKN